jgi:glycosyltransferase involved in cell wall biosynthesis
MKVALFHPCLIHGGIPRVFAELAEGFAERGMAVDMVQATPPPGNGAPGALRKSAREATGSRAGEAAVGGSVSPLPNSSTGRGVRMVDLNARRALTSVVPLVRYLRRERPGVLISGALQTNIAAAWARRLARVPTRLVITEHAILSAVKESARHLSTRHRTRISPFFVRHFYPWADAIVAVSEGAAADLARVAGIPRERIQVIHNPVGSPELLARAAEPFEHPWFDPGQPPVIVAVGRLDHFKDYPTLLQAFAQLRRDLRVRLLVIGEGEERAKLESLAGSLGILSDVAFPGGVPNVMPFMKHAAVFALSSKTESFGIVLIEALAVDTPIVATDCRYGPREILQDGALGTLVPVGDANAMAGALREALHRPRRPTPPEALAPYSREASLAAYCKLIGALSADPC